MTKPAEAATLSHVHLPGNAGAPELAQFFIPAAASLQERRPRTLKHGDTFAVFDHNGDVLSGPGSPEGVFHRDTRHLSHLYLTVDGARPLLLSSTLRDDNATLTCDLTNPDLYDDDGRVVLEHDLLHLRRTRFLWQGSCLERIVVRNYDERRQRVSIGIKFSADFADLFEVRGSKREKRGTDHEPEIGENLVWLRYTGLDRRKRTTRLSFDPNPTSLTAEEALYSFELEPGERKSIFMEVRCSTEGEQQAASRSFFTSLRCARRELRNSASRAAAIVTSNEIFNEAVRRSVSDLYMLITDTPHGPYPYAGIPWFSTFFGRDALITALETLWLDPTIAKGVLSYLAAHQAREVNAEADSEPGKILHEVRQGEMAELGEVPFRHYYGSIDSTPLFVMLAGAYYRRTHDLSLIKRIWPNIEAALHWIDEYGDRDGDGFIEYGRQTDEGLANQGWKDSHDSIFHEDGTLAKGPIALAEAQAYAFGAWEAAAELARALGLTNRAQACEARAVTLRETFDMTFFDEELGTYVLALDGDKRPCRVRSSNAGHALFTGIAFPERAEQVVDTMMGATSFCGWGVRTIASGEARYNPMSYHNGSIWPHDNALIVAGFARYGFQDKAMRIFEGMFAASTYVDLRRLPELFCGFSRQRAHGPTFYPVACIPQAWSAAAPLSMLQSCVGLQFSPAEQTITFDGPVLPSFLEEVTLKGLTIGDARVTVGLRRSGRNVVVDIHDQEGSVNVLANMA